MSRGNDVALWRPLAVWAGVTAAAAAAAAGTPGAWHAARPLDGPGDVAGLLVAVCASVLALALAWLWVVTSTTVAGLLAGRPRTAGGTARRLVLAACGAAVVAGSIVPARAVTSDGSELLVGLALPERAVAPARSPVRPVAPGRAAGATRYVVRPGDSLWSIARDHPGDADSVDQRWRAIWLANRDVVGDDPDLILPGQALRLPPTRTTQAPNSDGDR